MTYCLHQKFCLITVRRKANIDSDDVKTDTHQSESPVQSGSSEGVSSDNIDEDGETEESDIKQDTPHSQVKDDGESEEEGGEDNMEIKTADSLENSLKELIDHMLSDNVYVEIPKVDLNKVIVENSEIHKKCTENWTEFSPEAYVLIDEKFKSLKKNSQKEVNYLVKEFECRKSADAYARSNTARTGVLDCSKLHTYKYNEDLFKKVTTFPDGKNHGLIFILDWSGSMQYTMEDTLKQLYNLMWFCKKVNIPFEVYAFTNEYPNYVDGEKTVCYEKKTGVLSVGEWFSLMNIFTSKVNSKTLDEQMLNIYRVVHSFVSYCTYRIPMELHLSGTPLNESMVCLHQIIPQFKQENKLQKVQCIILTDGEACPLKYHREVQRPWEEEPYIGLGQLRPDTSFLRDRKTKQYL